MEKRFDFMAAVRGIAVAAVVLLPATVAHADLGFWSRALVGTWRHPSNGDVYRFNSNATYTFTAGKPYQGQVSHSGYWKIAQPTERESGGSMEGPVALVVKSRKRVVRRNGRNVTLSSSRDFRLVVDVVHSGDGGEIDQNRYFIGGTKWKRVP